MREKSVNVVRKTCGYGTNVREIQCDGFEDVGKWPQSKEFRKNLDMGKARELIDYI